MRTRRTAAFVALIIAVVGAVPSAALADTSTTNVIYVDNQPGSDCVNSGTGAGTASTPFCAIQDGVDAATAGDTVEVTGYGGSQYEPTTVNVSGTASAPITIEAAPGTHPLIGVVTSLTPTAPAFSISGASYVTVRGFQVADDTPQFADVTSSSDITLDENGSGTYDPWTPEAAEPFVEVAGSSSAVTVSRSTISVALAGSTSAVQIDSGSSDDAVVGNVINPESGIGSADVPLVTVAGASDTAITGNTITGYAGCVPAISITGASSGISVENNILASIGSACTQLSVDATAASGTTADYNLVYNTDSGAALYQWASTSYATGTALDAATGQGAHDVNANPQFNDPPEFGANYTLESNSPAIDAADSDAPGMLSTDLDGNACSYDPYVAITGAGSPAYCTRGAIQYQSQPLTATMQVSTVGALRAEIFDGEPPADPQGFAYNWGDGQTTDSTTSMATHTYAKPGIYTITEIVTDALGGSASSSTAYATEGNDYTPYGPLRLLDTRKGLGAPENPIQSGFFVQLHIAGNGSIPDNVSAVVLNLTAVDGTSGGDITAYADGTSAPGVSNLNYRTGAAVANSAIVPVGADGYVDLLDSGAADSTVELIADVSGYFSPTAASGYDGLSPARILDTRKGIGAAKAKVGAFSTLPLTIAGADSGLLPSSGITAVSLHVTEVNATAGGYVTVYPGGGTAPGISSLNYTVGQPVANTVIVPVPADGKVDLYNASAGSVDLIADVTGYYSKAVGTTTGVYVPIIPSRLLDTRKTSALSSEGSVSFAPLGSPFVGQPSLAYAINLTVTDPTAGGYITAYPTGSTVPGTSNVNFVKGQTVANLAQTVTGTSGRVTVANSEPGGTVQVIVDEFGYYTHN